VSRTAADRRRDRGRLVLVGALAGAASGLLGIGGGFVIVPLLVLWEGLPVERAAGTSLVAIFILALPGAATHAVLGHVDLALAALLTAGVVPGAAIGARLVPRLRTRVLERGFAVFLVAASLLLVLRETGLLSGV
jgi:uncharacterized membrane protein YfcA